MLVQVSNIYTHVSSQSINSQRQPGSNQLTQHRLSLAAEGGIKGHACTEASGLRLARHSIEQLRCAGSLLLLLLRHGAGEAAVGQQRPREEATDLHRRHRSLGLGCSSLDNLKMAASRGKERRCGRTWRGMIVIGNLPFPFSAIAIVRGRKISEGRWWMLTTVFWAGASGGLGLSRQGQRNLLEGGPTEDIDSDSVPACWISV